MQAFETYLEKHSDDERLRMLLEMRALVTETLGEFKEDLAYSMPTYYSKGQCICAFASQKNHMSLYIMPYDLLAEFSEELNKYNMGKSCIRFKKLGAEDIALFRKILDYCNTNYQNSQFYGKMNPKK